MTPKLTEAQRKLLTFVAANPPSADGSGACAILSVRRIGDSLEELGLVVIDDGRVMSVTAAGRAALKGGES